MIMILLTNAFDCKDRIKAVGGTYTSKTWSVTEEQLAKLVEIAAESMRMSNSRDTQFGRSFAAVVVDRDGEETTGADEMAPVLARLEAEYQAYRAAHA